MQFDPAQLAALAAILRSGSFDAAADALGVTPSAVSQRIKALEDRVGAALVLRTTPCTPTPAGARLAQHADTIALMEGALLRDLLPEAQAVQARVRIAVNADSLAAWFMPALANLPDRLFDLVIDDQDHSAEWLKRGEVSAAVTSQASAAAGCHVQPLGALRYVATASPAFKAKWFGDGVTEASVAKAPVLTFNPKDQLQARWIKEITGTRVTPPHHILPSTHAFIEATCAGLGWGMNPLSMVEGHLGRGTLVAIVPDRPLDVPLYWQVSRILQSPLGQLTQAVRRAGRDVLVPPITQP